MIIAELTSTKTCRHCGVEFRKPPRQNSGWWTRAKFCSAACSIEAKRPPLLTCATCQTEFRPRHGPARGAKFCSRACTGISQRVANPKSRYRKVTVNGKKVLEHRHVMAQKLGRPLLPHEHVHHENEQKRDNAPDNLELLSATEHGRLHHPPIRPVTSDCQVCGATFTPHKTKRGRKKTCSSACMRQLLKDRWHDNHPEHR